MFILLKTAFAKNTRCRCNVTPLLKLRISQYFSYRYLNETQGFTLIELLVVVIIIGILSAVALPNLINQTGKARETEAKNNLGVISRGQQAYHYEHGHFYNESNLENFIGFNSIGKYYTFTSNSSSDPNKAFHTAYATNFSDSRARDFAAGIYYNSSNYSQTICIANAVGNNGTTSSVTAQADGSCNGGTSIQ